MTSLKQQLLDVKGGRNFRELGGYQTVSGKKIKMHKLIRSGHLADLLKEDQEYLRRYGLKYDIDLRTSFERNKQPDRKISGVEYFADPVFDEDLTNSTMSISDMARESQDPGWGYQRMLWAYKNMATGKNANKAYQHLFEVLLANEKDSESVLFHCTAGKDRTGFGAILILTALGVPMKTIEKDYLFTNEVIKDFVSQLLAKEKAAGADDSSWRPSAICRLYSRPTSSTCWMSSTGTTAASTPTFTSRSASLMLTCWICGRYTWRNKRQN